MKRPSFSCKKQTTLGWSKYLIREFESLQLRKTQKMHLKNHTMLDRHTKTRKCNVRGFCRASCSFYSPHMAEMVGFEPTYRLPDKRISSAPRYDHFDTSPNARYCKLFVLIIQLISSVTMLNMRNFKVFGHQVSEPDICPEFLFCGLTAEKTYECKTEIN